MKLTRFEYHGSIYNGTIEKDEVAVVNGDLWGDCQATDQMYPLSKVKILPLVVPSKIICIGLNYKQHIEEMGMEALESPSFFLKPPSCLIAHNESIVIPRDGERVDYEGELAAVIKDRIKNVERNEALSHVLGYCCFNDVTERALVAKSLSFLTQAKGYDTFGAMGPYLVTDVDPDHLEVKTSLNGRVMQHDNTKNCIFDLASILSYVSRCMTLYPGDIVATGTPKGVAPLKPGDVVEVEIEGIGKLRNPVISED